MLLAGMLTFFIVDRPSCMLRLLVNWAFSEENNWTLGSLTFSGNATTLIVTSSDLFA
jgi:hypothetical protein